MEIDDRSSILHSRPQPLHPAVLAIDLPANLRHGITLLDHLRRIQRLVLAEVHSGRRVAIYKTGEKTSVTHMLIAFAIAIELVQDVRNLLRHPIGCSCFSNKESRR